MRSEAGPEGATTERKIEEKQPLEPSPTAPQYPLPLASARMEPGDIVGAAVDITPLFREFASGGRFEIRWEIGDLKTETLPLNIIKTVYAVIDTNKGPIRVVLFEDEAPKNVARFVELARKGFYDGRPFHLALDTQDLALVQTGSPTGTGTGRAEGELLPLEPTGRRLKTGTVVMARTSDPNSASAQFFIIKRISESLADEYKGRYTVIGQVVSETAPQMGPHPPYGGGGAPPTPAQPDSIQILMSLAKGDTVNKITIYEKPPLK
jgi:cyclophilin family peptidyl-prolyl cis-trans isomerase